MVNGQSSCATREKENSEPALPSGKRVKLNDANAGKSCASGERAACADQKREEKVQARLLAGQLAEQNRQQKAKRDEEQLKARQALSRLQDAEAEQRRKPEVPAHKAPQRQERIAADGQREQKVCVAFCLQCTGTFVPLAALVCHDLSSAAALQEAAKEAQRQERIAANEQREQKVCVAFCLPCGTGTVLGSRGARVRPSTSLQRCSASAAGTVCRGFQAAAEKAAEEAQQFAETEALELTGSELRRNLKEDGLKWQQRAELRRRLRDTLKRLAEARQPTRRTRWTDSGRSRRNLDAFVNEMSGDDRAAEHLHGPLDPEFGDRVGSLFPQHLSSPSAARNGF